MRDPIFNSSYSGVIFSQKIYQNIRGIILEYLEIISPASPAVLGIIINGCYKQPLIMLLFII